MIRLPQATLTFLVIFSILAMDHVHATERKCPSDDHPNIVVILTGDLGYGDVAHLNPESKIQRPRLDALASLGVTALDTTISLTDIYATLAAITGSTIPNGAAEDSVNLLPASPPWRPNSNPSSAEEIRRRSSTQRPVNNHENHFNSYQHSRGDGDSPSCS